MYQINKLIWKYELSKKIENAELYIKEIEKHKKSIFEFWKFTNKDEKNQLSEGISKIEEDKKIENKFENLVVLNFGFNKATTILDYLNENKSLIIDFENKKALLIKEKIPNWNHVFKEYMSTDKVMQAYRRDIIEDIPSFLQDLEDDTVGTLLF